MAITGTYTYRTTRDQIINSALRLCGAVDPENASGATATQLSNGSEALNLMLKAWEADGLHLWLRRYAVVFPVPSQTVFTFGSPGPAGDHACLSTPLGSGYIQTTLSATAAGAATSITLGTITSALNSTGNPGTTIANAFNIGIQLDAGTVQWTTVSGAPTGTTVTLAAGLTSQATAGNYVFAYQTKLIKPMRVLDGMLRSLSGGNDIPCMVISREMYNRFGVKTSSGSPIQLYYDVQENSGNLYVYPTFLNASMLLQLEIESPVSDITASTDDYDLPQEWGEAIKYNLAIRIAPEYEVPSDKFQQLSALATVSLENARDWDQESPASVQMEPDMWMYGQNYR